jgi:hypothetical protein
VSESDTSAAEREVVVRVVGEGPEEEVHVAIRAASKLLEKEIVTARSSNGSGVSRPP